MAPTVGKIVHYIDKDGFKVGAEGAVFNRSPRPALVTRVDSTGSVSLTVFTPTGVSRLDGVAYSEGPAAGCWSWPPKDRMSTYHAHFARLFEAALTGSVGVLAHPDARPTVEGLVSWAKRLAECGAEVLVENEEQVSSEKVETKAQRAARIAKFIEKLPNDFFLGTATPLDEEAREIRANNRIFAYPEYELAEET